MRRIFLSVLLMVILGAMGPQAATEIGSESNPHQLADSIVVTATRTATPLREIGNSITVITARHIELAQCTHVRELLRTVPGLDVVQSGGAGQATSVFIRGSNSNHTLVIIDGVEMNDPSSPNRAFDFSRLNTDNIERIEVLRGPQSVLYGSDAIGGVVRIFTKRGDGRPEVSLSSQGGSFGTFRKSVTLSGATSGVDYLATASREDTDGISAAAEQYGGHERDGFSNTTISTQVGYRPNQRFDLSFFGGYTDQSTDLDQAGGVLDDPNVDLRTLERYIGFRLSDQTAADLWFQQIGVNYSRINRTSEDKTDNDHPMDTHLTSANGWRLSFDWQHDFVLSRSHTLTGGVESKREEFSQNLFFNSQFGPYESAVPKVGIRTVAVYAMYQASLFDQWYTTVGVRYDDHEQFGTASTYRIASAFLFDRPAVKLKASLGTGFKAPSLLEFYDPLWGNQDLRPEETQAWETGVEWDAVQDRLMLGIVYFYNKYSDLIRWDPVKATSINIAESRSRGIETTVEFKYASLSAIGEYTYTRSRDKATDLSLIRRPEHKASLSAAYRFGRRADISFSGRFSDQREDNNFLVYPAERVTLPEYTVVGLSGSLTMSENLRLFGRIDNLFNRRYVKVFSYGTEPRSGYLGLEITI